MRQCPACSGLYADAIDVCPADGARLPEPDPLLGTLLDGKYRIDARVGSGAMGTVYRGEQLSLGRRVAVKVIRSEAKSASVERFRREARAVARLRHPNIVVVYDFAVAEEAGAYLVMELLEGRPVRDEIRARGTLTASEAAGLVLQACAAVHASHEAGVLHRDLKSGNLFLEERRDGTVVKVLDFGLAKLFAAEGTGAEPLTAEGVVFGTPLYMSPEQWLGDPLDARSDVYSLGCVFYEALTGRPPFSEASRTDLLMRKLVGAPRAPEGVPRAAADVIDRALAPRPDDRFASAAELADALAEIDGQRAAGHGTMASHSAAVAAETPAPSPPTNLPRSLTTFVGRESQVEELARSLGRRRCVTLTGTGGVGKTRLAIEVARSLAPAYPSGVWFVDLGRSASADLAASVVADALGLKGRSSLDAVCEAVGSARVLLVLDNCEHLLEASAAVAERLLAACAELRILATSREPLRVPGELVWSVPGLSLSAERDAGAAEAVRLFVDRARLANPSFALSDDEAKSAARLCERLECLPLAIELAAACVRVLTVDEILGKLGDRFRLLTGGGRTAAPRQRTLRATIDWSYDLLADEERALLRRLSVFKGGWALDAAEAVAGCRLPVAGSASGSTASPESCAVKTDPATGNRQPATDEVRQHLERLVDKSLVVADGDGRYHMLDTVREYAREKLAACGEEVPTARKHRDYFLTLAERARDEIASQQQAEWLRTLGADVDNLRAALRWNLDAAERETALRMAAALFRYFEVSGRPAEGCRWLEEALKASGDAPPDLVADALFGLALLRFDHSEYGPAREAVEECVRLRRGLGDRAGVARTLNLYSLVLHYLGELDASYDVQRESLDLSLELGLDPSVTQAKYHLGMLASSRGDFDEATAYLAESAERWTAAGNRLAAVGALLNLAEAERARGDLRRAAELIDECLAVGRELGAKAVVAASCTVKAVVLGVLGDRAAALGYFEEAVALHGESGHVSGTIEVVEGVALVAAAAGDMAAALRLVAAATAARARIDYARDPSSEGEVERLRAGAAAALGVARALDEEAVGERLSLDDAVEEALRGLDGGRE